MSSIKSVRIGKVERPRPLRSLSTSSATSKGVEDVLADLEKVCRMISAAEYGPTLASAITSLSYHLKLMGHQLEGVCKDELDRRFVQLRNGCRDERLDRPSRVRLLELVELRAQQTPWTSNDNVTMYYRQMLQLVEGQQQLSAGPVSPPLTSGHSAGGGDVLASPVDPSQPPPLLTPGEVLRGSGKYPKPTRIQGKFKDEVVIRNADSGKVMGMKGIRVHKIEELSQTVISFQRVSAGAKERLVQITGGTEENVLRARALIEDVIRRNASPVREEPRSAMYSLAGADGSTGSLSSANSDEPGRRGSVGEFGSLGEFRYTVFAGEHAIRLTGKNLDVVKTAKIVLDEYFNNAPSLDDNSFEPLLETVPEAGNGLLGAGDGSSGFGDNPRCPSPTDLIAAEAQTVLDPTVDTSATAPPTGPPSNGHAEKHNATANEDEGRKIRYTRQELLMYAKSAVAKYPPPGWAEVRDRHPAITRQSPKVFDPDTLPVVRPVPSVRRQASGDTASRSPTPP